MFALQNVYRDFEILEDLNYEKKIKIYKQRFTPFDLDDEEFFSRYRFYKITTRYIINLLNIEEPKSNRGLPIPISLQVLTALRFFGRNAHQSDIGDVHGMSQQTVGRILKNISKKIALLFPHFIKFPNNSVLAEVKRKFYQVAMFPTVIGAIDCTHIKIKCPAKIVGKRYFLNRKGFYSLNVQIVCDADCKIIDIVARSRGSKHDARIWSECQLKSKLELTKREHNEVLLGDAGYPLSSILLTPIRNPSAIKEERYNKSQIATRSKFRSIFERIRVDLDTAKNIVVAVAVLHNIAKERNFSFLDVSFAVEPGSQHFDVPSSSSTQANNSLNSGQLSLIHISRDISYTPYKI